MHDNHFNILDLSLRGDLEWLLERATELGQEPGGSTIFIAGEEGSGRTHLLNAFVKILAGSPSAPLVLSGTFESGQYVAKNHLDNRDGQSRLSGGTGTDTTSSPSIPLKSSGLLV